MAEMNFFAGYISLLIVFLYNQRTNQYFINNIFNLKYNL